MKKGEQFPESYCLEHGYVLRLDKMSLVFAILLGIFDLLSGSLPYRPSDVVLESPDGDVLSVRKFFDPPGEVGMRKIWNAIEEIGLKSWLEMRRDTEWSIKKKRRNEFDQFISRLE